MGRIKRWLQRQWAELMRQYQEDRLRSFNMEIRAARIQAGIHPLRPMPVSRHLLTDCCGAPLLLVRDEGSMLDWVYCGMCGRRPALVLDEDRWRGDHE